MTFPLFWQIIDCQMKLANLKENFCLTHFVFKGATKYNRKVFFFPPQKYADTEPTL